MNKFKNIVPNNMTKVNSSIITNILFNISHKNELSDNNTEQESMYSTPLILTKLMGGNRTLVTMVDAVNRRETVMPLCDAMPPDLGELVQHTVVLETLQNQKQI